MAAGLAHAGEVGYPVSDMCRIFQCFALLLLMAGAWGCAPQRPAESTSPDVAAARDPSARPEFGLGRDSLDERVKELTQGYQVSNQVVGRLEEFEALEQTLERGQCYVLVFRLGPGAAFGAHARRGVKVVTAFELEEMVEYQDAIVGPGAVLDAGCPLVDGHLVVDLQATWNADKDMTRSHDLGTGPYTWLVYSSPISEDELLELQHSSSGSGGTGERSEPARSRTDQKGRASEDPRTIRFQSECAEPVRLFVGPDPATTPGPVITMKPRAPQTRSLQLGETVWLLDREGRGIGIVKVTAVIDTISVASDCIGISAT